MACFFPAASGMLIYVDLEHASLQQADPTQWEAALARRLKIKYAFEDLAQSPCLIVRYHQLSPELVERVNARAVVVSGCSSEYASYSEASLAGLRAVYQSAARPVLGLCAGMQLMAQTYGAPLGPMGPWDDQPADAGSNPFPEVGYRPGLKEEHGFTPVTVLEPQPLFEGLGSPAMVYESHFWEVKAPPAGFRVSATTARCPIQALAHESRPLFGTQFHPELYDDAHTDGRQLLVNFFRLAGLGTTA